MMQFLYEFQYMFITGSN